MESWRHRLPRVASATAWLLLAFVGGPSAAQTSGDGTASKVPALFVFGDSIVDAGNNNNLVTQVKSNFPPYGKDFLGRVPSGRFSNGKVPGDILASRLGVKEYLPAYRGSLSLSDILTGVTFASGGAGFDPLTSSRVSVISMQGQLNLFRQYRTRLSSAVGAVRAMNLTSEALFLICSGTDDFANTYFGGSVRTSQFSLMSYVNFVASQSASFVYELIMLGARKIAFVGMPPIGCLPSQRTAGGGLARQCDPLRNEAARMYNTRMSELLAGAKSRLPPGGSVQVLDIYSVLLDIIQNPKNYGMDEVTRGCCGTGVYEAAMLCNPWTPVTCSDDSKYLFWDAFHPTQRGYEILVDKLLARYDLA